MDEKQAGYDKQTARLPERAWKLAMRALELERKYKGRGRVTLDVVMLDELWLLGVVEPGPLERLGE